MVCMYQNIFKLVTTTIFLEEKNFFYIEKELKQLQRKVKERGYTIVPLKLLQQNEI